MNAQMNRALIALGLTLGVAACDSGNGTPAAEAVKKEVAAPAPVVALGQTGGTDGVELTVTDVSMPTQVGSADTGAKAGPGETFVVVSYTMKNVGPKPLPYGERPKLALIDAQGNSYALDDSASFMASFLMDDASGMTSDLNPNVSAKTKMAWKVDKAAFDKATWKVRLDSPSQPVFALQ